MGKSTRFKDIIAQKKTAYNGPNFKKCFIPSKRKLSFYLYFRLGEPFEEETSDGRKCTTTVTMEGNKLITDQKAIKKGEKDVRAVSYPPRILYFQV